MIPFDVSDVTILALETILKVSLVLGVAAWIVRAIRQRFPSGAHLTWVLAFAIVLVLPIAASVMPWQSVLFLNLRPAQSRASNTSLIPHASPASPASKATPASNASLASFASPETDQPPILLVLVLQSPWFVAAFFVWLAGLLAVGARSGYGFYCLGAIRRKGTRETSSIRLMAKAARLGNEVGLKRAFELRICSRADIPIPMTWGVLRPTIVLPRDAETWSDSRFEATMLHELSHVRRNDFAAQMLAEIVCALYWFNPLAWFGARTMRSDAELAADESVLQAGLKPSDYASELLKLAADLGKRPIPFATLGTPAMTNSKIENRLESILSPSAGRRGITTVQVLAAIAAAAIAVPTFASLHASAQGQNAEDLKAERTVALSNAKQIALATIMYSEDYDKEFPYVQQTDSAVEVLQPYSKSKEIFKSPTKGGRFLFNMNLGGVKTTSIEYPAQTPLWIESLRDPKMHVAVAFADGHAKLIDPTTALDEKNAIPGMKLTQFPAGTTWLKALASQRFPRSKGTVPLPYNYLLPEKP